MNAVCLKFNVDNTSHSNIYLHKLLRRWFILQAQFVPLEMPGHVNVIQARLFPESNPNYI